MTVKEIIVLVNKTNLVDITKIIPIVTQNVSFLVIEVTRKKTHTFVKKVPLIFQIRILLEKENLNLILTKNYKNKVINFSFFVIKIKH